MENIKYCLKNEDFKYIIVKVDLNSFDNIYKDYNMFDNVEDMFAYMFNSDDKLSFLDIFKIFNLNGIEYNKTELIKYYIYNCREICDFDNEIYMKIKINKGSIYEILSILPKELSSKKNIKGVSLTLKMLKQYIPFYLSIFIKDYCIEDYHITIKNLFKNKKNIPYVDLYNHDKEYYVIKNRDKIVHISTTRKMANHYVDIISSIRKDKSMYFVPNIEIVFGFKNLINYLKIQNPNVRVNNLKNIVDFRGDFTENDTIKDDDYLLDNLNSKYVLRTNENEFILKDDVDSIYNFVLENKIHSPEIMEIFEMKRVVSTREIFKSIFLSNTMENKDLLKLNGVSILEDDNLLKVYSNIVSIFLEYDNFNPLIAVLNSDNNTTDVRFFFDEDSLRNYVDNFEGISIQSFNYISTDYIHSKVMEKNLEILMNEDNTFKSDDFVFNLSYLYSKTNRHVCKIKQLKDVQCIIDVDSSLDNGIASCGIVIRDSSGKILGKISKRLNAHTSVEAEIRGAMHAIKYAILEDFTEICLRYDYVGIFEYLIGEPTTEIRKEYQDFFLDVVNKYDVDIYFKKVKAHSLDEYNDLADYLASNLNVNESFYK